MLIQLYGTQVKFEDLSDETLELINRKLDFCQVKTNNLGHFVQFSANKKIDNDQDDLDRILN